MRSMTKLILSALLLSLLLVSGCTDRGSNSAPEYNGNSGRLILNHVFFWEMVVQIKNESQLTFPQAWVPNVGVWGAPPNYTPDRQLPLLILLPPQGGDQHYYFNHGLAQVANELLTEGLIEPMVIVTPANEQTFGGYWWAGSGGGAGNYDTLVGGTMLDWIWASALGTNAFDTTQAMTGIGGIGEGAYGAFRAAMKHPGRFGSISAIDGPLDFDGVDGASGLINLFDDVLNEQDLLGDEDYLVKFDSSGQFQLGRLFIGGALAFSPNDTLVSPVITALPAGGFSVTVPDSVRFRILGTAGLDTAIIQVDNDNFDFHLPFDKDGNPINEPDAPIWDLWMRNSLDKMYHAYHRSGEDFNDVDLWFATAIQNDPLGYNKMTQAFIQLLRSYGYEPDVKFYDGYPGNPAYTDEYLNHLLREMLIFHSNAFKRAQQDAE